MASNAPPRSTRLITRQTGNFTRSTAGSQSLQRGLTILRTFLSGAPALTNAQLAERANLPKPTVSRLTHSLVTAEFLEYDASIEGYRLSPVYLTFARAFRVSRTEIEVALPLMRIVAKTYGLNIGLTTRDGLMMTYLETIREIDGHLRHAVIAGSQMPIEQVSMGHAYLSAMRPAGRKQLFGRIAKKRGRDWPI